MSKERGGQAETLLDQLRRIDELSPRHPVRRSLVDGAAGLFGVSRSMVSRARAPQQHRPRGRRRTDRGEPRTSILVSHSLAACYLRCSRHRSPRHFRNGGGIAGHDSRWLVAVCPATTTRSACKSHDAFRRRGQRHHRVPGTIRLPAPTEARSRSHHQASTRWPRPGSASSRCAPVRRNGRRLQANETVLKRTHHTLSGGCVNYISLTQRYSHTHRD